MTASAYFGIKSLTLISYIAVPLVAILGSVAMVMAVKQGHGTLIDQFAKSSGTLTVVGGAGLVIGSFVSGGTATPNFSRFARNGKVGAITTVIAFFIGNSLMFFFGGIFVPVRRRNDIFEVMSRPRSEHLAILVLGLNIWTTNDNALYTAGLGLANIFGQRKKPMVLISGIVGTVLSVWLYWNLRLAEYPQLHTAAGRHYSGDELLYEPREVQRHGDHRNGELVCGYRRSAGRCGGKSGSVGYRPSMAQSPLLCAIIWSAARRKISRIKKIPSRDPKVVNLLTRGLIGIFYFCKCLVRMVSSQLRTV